MCQGHSHRFAVYMDPQEVAADNDLSAADVSVLERHMLAGTLTDGMERISKLTRLQSVMSVEVRDNTGKPGIISKHDRALLASLPLMQISKQGRVTWCRTIRLGEILRLVPKQALPNGHQLRAWLQSRLERTLEALI